MKRLDHFPYTNILILGLAKSGTACAKLLLSGGKRILVNDMGVSENDEAVTELKQMGAEIVVGSHPLFVLDDMEIVVKNPGIPYDNPIITEALKRGIPVITEIEIAYYLAGNNIIGITGSNGKTTTTTLVHEMLLKSMQPVQIAGNIGIVASEVANRLEEKESLVLELSSFQLQGIEKFKPKTAVLLNIYEAHLDYHKTFANYKEAKCNIFKNQSSEDYLVYNYDDPTIQQEIHHAKAKLVPFSVKQRLDEGVWLDGDTIYFHDEKIMDRRQIVLVGDHNLENILAAVGAAKLNGATNKGIQQVLTTFSGVKHRLQFVDNINGRLFYNDSKATNILATQKALASFKNPTILLAGGLDRGNEFTDLLPYLNQVKAMIVFGETQNKLKELARDAGIDQVAAANDVGDAVEQAYACSKRDDVILLSPACASWDQYRTFEERGDMFIQAVHRMM